MRADGAATMFRYEDKVAFWSLSRPYSRMADQFMLAGLCFTQVSPSMKLMPVMPSVARPLARHHAASFRAVSFSPAVNAASTCSRPLPWKSRARSFIRYAVRK